MASRNRPLAPVRAIFHDVLPAEARDIPQWMQRRTFSSAPPETAAALLHASDPRKKREPTSDYPRPGSKPPSFTPASSDPALDARIQNAALASEVSESWQPPPSSPANDSQPPRLDLAMEEVRAAIAALQETRTQLLRELEPQLLALTRMVAERVLETELPQDHELSIRLVHEGLHALDHNGHVTVVLGSGFASEATHLQTRLEEEGIRCEIQVAEHLPTYACRIRTELGAVDESVETRLDKVLATILEGED